MLMHQIIYTVSTCCINQWHVSLQTGQSHFKFMPVSQSLGTLRLRAGADPEKNFEGGSRVKIL